MATDLEALRSDILSYLEAAGVPVFHGYAGYADASHHVYWDTDQHADFREFLTVAQAAGIKLIVFHHLAFALDQIDEALDQLEDSQLGRDEKRNFESRLRELQPYEGFTCSLELSFALEGRVYLYQRSTEWYRALEDVLAELDAVTMEEEDAPDDSIGGYFSNN